MGELPGGIHGDQQQPWLAGSTEGRTALSPGSRGQRLGSPRPGSGQSREQRAELWGLREGLSRDKEEARGTNRYLKK